MILKVVSWYPHTNMQTFTACSHIIIVMKLSAFHSTRHTQVAWSAIWFMSSSMCPSHIMPHHDAFTYLPTVIKPSPCWVSSDGCCGVLNAGLVSDPAMQCSECKFTSQRKVKCNKPILRKCNTAMDSAHPEEIFSWSPVTALRIMMPLRLGIMKHPSWYAIFGWNACKSRTFSHRSVLPCRRSWQQTTSPYDVVEHSSRPSALTQSDWIWPLVKL